MASMAYISNSESWPENGLVGSSAGLGCSGIPKKCQGKMIELPNCSREIHFTMLTMLRLEVQEASCPMESNDFPQKIKKCNKNLFHEIAIAARPISIGFSDFLEETDTESVDRCCRGFVQRKALNMQFKLFTGEHDIQSFLFLRQDPPGSNRYTRYTSLPGVAHTRPLLGDELQCSLEMNAVKPVSIASPNSPIYITNHNKS